MRKSANVSGRVTLYLKISLQPLQYVVNGRSRSLSASLSALARLLPLANH